MANGRRHVQVLHERFNVQLFLEEFNARYQTDFAVVEEPDPPEAIIQSSNTKRWVEVTTAYLNEEQAKDLSAYAVKGEKPQLKQQRAIVNPNEQFAKQFIGVVAKKLKKSSYEPFFKQYGKGYLIVSIQHPMFDQQALAAIEQAWNEAEVHDKGFFKSIYIIDRVSHGYKVSLWKSNLS